MRNAKITPQQVREIAARACCDPRTVLAYLKGRPQRSTTKRRIEMTFHETGTEVLAPIPATTLR